jgi:HPt (histidine-containing phosphotransfer) domain-containing protein
LQGATSDLPRLCRLPGPRNEPIYLLQKQHAPFQACPGPELPFTNVGDQTRLRQILANLVGNAVKFSPGDEVTIRVESRPAGDGRLHGHEAHLQRIPAQLPAAHRGHDGERARGRSEALHQCRHERLVCKPVRLETLRAALERCAALRPVTDEPGPLRAESEPAQAEFDPAALASLRALTRSGEPDLFDQLVGTYCQRLGELMLEIRQAVSYGDSAALRPLCHRLRASSGNVGASGIAALFGCLEALGRAGCLAGASELLAELESHTARVGLESRVIPGPD